MWEIDGHQTGSDGSDAPAVLLTARRLHTATPARLRPRPLQSLALAATALSLFGLGAIVLAVMTERRREYRCRWHGGARAARMQRCEARAPEAHPPMPRAVAGSCTP